MRFATILILLFSLTAFAQTPAQPEKLPEIPAAILTRMVTAQALQNQAQAQITQIGANLQQQYQQQTQPWVEQGKKAAAEYEAASMDAFKVAGVTSDKFEIENSIPPKFKVKPAPKPAEAPKAAAPAPAPETKQ